MASIIVREVIPFAVLIHQAWRRYKGKGVIYWPYDPAPREKKLVMAIAQHEREEDGPLDEETAATGPAQG